MLSEHYDALKALRFEGPAHRLHLGDANETWKTDLTKRNSYNKKESQFGSHKQFPPPLWVPSSSPVAIAARPVIYGLSDKQRSPDFTDGWWQ